MSSYVNYHCHTHYSNLQTTDSTINYDNYVKRIKELGYGCLMSTEHGWQGNYLECYEIAKNNNIPFRYGVEAYWVLDNKEKDRTNNHIVILAKSAKGIKAINLALSNANIDGFYYKPRLSISQILNLPKNDVFITTACIAFNGYGEELSKSIILDLYNKFEDNFMLEVQSHNTKKQKEWNKFILTIHNEYNINIIAGMDSHYIYSEQSKERDALLRAKGIIYENEEGWFLDFPSYEIVKKRFIKQGILTLSQIINSLENTNIVKTFDDVEFSTEIKVPNIFPNKTYEERVFHFKELITNSWKIEKNNIPKEKRDKYIEEINKEINIVVETRMVDYFILNYYVIKKAIEMGGQLTLTSRGSAPSFYINNLLGFTTIDRISSPIQLFPERFMSVSRILETKSIPDIDFNISNPEVFIKAQKIILGENSTYSMIAFGKLKEKSAFKTYARANNIDFEISNQITKSIAIYESEEKHNKGKVKIEDYVNKEHLEVYKESVKYRGVIDSASKHPCAVISYSGNTLEDIGVMRLRNEIVTVIDGKYLDKYKYVKNDFLKVNVVGIIYDVFKEIKVEPIPSNELIKITENDELVWKIFSDGITLGINQVEQEGTRKKCMQYKMKNVSETSGFVAGIRPGFSSLIDKFLKRERFSYGIKDFDELIQTEQMQDSWLLYQEQIMQTLQYAGFPTDECYSLIKAIAKKVEGVIDRVEDRFLKGFVNKGNSLEDAKKIWEVILDNSRYSFNSSHSLSTALDAIYGAYLKSHYPYEFYKVMLKLYTENKDIDKVSALKKEMIYFDIHIGELKYGLDNTDFVIDKNNKCINQSLKTVKYINSQVAEDMTLLKDNNASFPQIINSIKENTSINSRQLTTLVSIGYFKEFGSIKKCLTFIEYCDKLKKKTYRLDKVDKELEKYFTIGGSSEIVTETKTIKKELWNKNDKIIKETAKRYTIQREVEIVSYPFCEKTATMYKNIEKEIVLDNIWNEIPEDEFELKIIMKYEQDLLGYISDIPNDISLGKVEMVSVKNRSANIKSLRTNKSRWFRFKKDESSLPNKGETIIIENMYKKKGWKGRIDWYIKKYEKL
jgi:DNA polymerase III alpha subunit